MSAERDPEGMGARPRGVDPPRDHYSYTVYADPAMAARFDGARFGGPIGSLLAETQARVLFDFLGDIRDREIIDVGTGTGRAALALAARGAHVLGIDASAEMLRVAQERAAASGLPARFEVGDAHALSAADQSFDMAVSLRVIMHTPDWQQCLGELCRVSRTRIVFDFPAALSAAAIQAGSRRVLAAMGRTIESYRVFRLSAVRAVVAAHGFTIVRVHRQFVLPIGLHKLVGSRAATETIERALERCGLLRVFGSPVTVVAERCES